MSAAFPYLSDTFRFGASSSWAKRFKILHRIRQRKITRFISGSDFATLDDTVKAAEGFQKQAKFLMSKFSAHLVINTDQTGCQYQLAYNRSLDFQGVKTVLAKKEKLASLTHSYTAQYALTASGELLPKVFLCMAEPGNEFGPKVSVRVKSLEKEYQNIVVVASKSGKLTKELYKNFLHAVIKPYVGEKDFLLLIDSWGGPTDTNISSPNSENILSAKM